MQALCTKLSVLTFSSCLSPTNVSHCNVQCLVPRMLHSSVTALSSKYLFGCLLLKMMLPDNQYIQNRERMRSPANDDGPFSYSTEAARVDVWEQRSEEYTAVSLSIAWNLIILSILSCEVDFNMDKLNKFSKFFCYFLCFAVCLVLFPLIFCF